MNFKSPLGSKANEPLIKLEEKRGISKFCPIIKEEFLFLLVSFLVTFLRHTHTHSLIIFDCISVFQRVHIRKGLKF